MTAVGMPLLMAIGGIVVWRRSKAGPAAPKDGWRDTSLDDWMREREDHIDSVRKARADGSGDEE